MPRESPMPPDREQALQDAILSYLKAVDAGELPEPREFIARHPDLSGDLNAFFADQAQLSRLVGPLLGLAPRAVAPASPPDGREPQTVEDATDCQPREIGNGPPAIPGYEILGPPKRGGMAFVYKARQVRLNRVVALKVIRGQRRPNSAEQARFHAEAQTVARLDHPNIVRVFDSGEQDGVPYLVLEFVAGGSLAEKVAAGPLSPPAAARLLLQIVDAIGYAHNCDVVHRDLKPANILLTPDGLPKVADFGLSKQMQAAAGCLTQAGDVLGTPAFMSPEQAAGVTDAIGPGTDIFGLGALLYALLTGHPPFQGDTVSEILQNAKAGRVTPPRKLNGCVPVPLERICLKAMAADPRQRYPSAAAFANALRRYLRRSRRRFWAAAVLTAAIAAAIPLALPGFHRPNVDNHNPPPPGHQVNATELAVRAKGILKANCHRCHGENGNVEGGFNFVVDRQQLVARKKIVPGRPDDSKLLKRVENGEMPPEGESPRPSPEDVVLLRQWIEADAPDFAPAAPERKFISPDDLHRYVRDDLEKAPETDRRFYRYFTITHLANAGLPEDCLQSYRLGLAKLVNSLSWRRLITVPAPVDPGRTILRIDLRDFEWKETVWQQVLADYPYRVIEPGASAGLCAAWTKCPLPHVRADWFVAAASRPPLYHTLLQLPATAQNLEGLLRVDVAGDITNYHVARAGFNGSGVANANRLIERHESNYGAYWKSYDFAVAEGPGDNRRNLFQHPLGPGVAPNTFLHDGGEIIFSLPNHLHGYMLVDGQGRRIDKGPTSLVKDVHAKDAAVTNGISCMSCHSHGIIDKQDQIREHVAKNPGAFDKSEAENIRAIYPPRDKFAALVRKDAEQFAAAVRETGASPGRSDPVVELASHYEWDLDADLAAAEVGLPRPVFLEGLNRAADLSRVMGQLANAGGTVQRAVFDAHFARVIDALQVGTMLPRPSPPAPASSAPPAQVTSRKAPAEDDGVFRNSIGMSFRRIERGSFSMGSADDDPHAAADEKPMHDVLISQPFFLGVFEVTREEYARVMGQDLPVANLKRLPVANVTQAQAVEFCSRLTLLPSEKRLGRRYRLPTEAEWEYACRAGTTAASPFEPPEKLEDFAWCDKDSGGRPHAVGEKKANPWGLHDMLGNVAEWCSDVYEDGYYRQSPRVDPIGPGKSPLPFAVLRGGSFLDGAAKIRSADRQHTLKDFHTAHYGFRVLLEIP
jgi:formylglycine-generating enzyme required for sulfatase activity/tRNA A-37 threonylcarbamoyl transferase component Bud32/mono/diheme cytochrome c family protein